MINKRLYYEKSAVPLDPFIHINMNSLTRHYRQLLPFALTILSLGSYIAIFASYRNELGTGIASLATIPVIVAGWYFGVQGGLTAAVFCIVVSAYLQSLAGQSINIALSDHGNTLRIISLILIAIVTGRLSS